MEGNKEETENVINQSVASILELLHADDGLMVGEEEQHNVTHLEVIQESLSCGSVAGRRPDNGGAAGGGKSLHGQGKLKVRKPSDLEISHLDNSYHLPRLSTSVSIPSHAFPPVSSATNCTCASTTAITISDDEEDTDGPMPQKVQASQKKTNGESTGDERQLAAPPQYYNNSAAFGIHQAVVATQRHLSPVQSDVHHNQPFPIGTHVNAQHYKSPSMNIGNVFVPPQSSHSTLSQSSAIERFSMASNTYWKQRNEGILPGCFPQNCVPVRVENKTVPNYTTRGQWRQPSFYKQSSGTAPTLPLNQSTQVANSHTLTQASSHLHTSSFTSNPASTSIIPSRRSFTTSIPSTQSLTSSFPSNQSLTSTLTQDNSLGTFQYSSGLDGVGFLQGPPGGVSLYPGPGGSHVGYDSPKAPFSSPMRQPFRNLSVSNQASHQPTHSHGTVTNMRHRPLTYVQGTPSHPVVSCTSAGGSWPRPQQLGFRGNIHQAPVQTHSLIVAQTRLVHQHKTAYGVRQPAQDKNSYQGYNNSAAFRFPTSGVRSQNMKYNSPVHRDVLLGQPLPCVTTVIPQHYESSRHISKNADSKDWSKSEEGLVPLRPPIPLPQNCIPQVKSGLLQDGKPEGDDVNVCTEKLSVVSDIKLMQENEGSFPVPQNCVPVRDIATLPNNIQAVKEVGDCPISSRAVPSQSSHVFQSKVVLTKLDVSPNQCVMVSSIYSTSSSKSLPGSASSQSRYGRTLKPRLISLSTRSLESQMKGSEPESDSCMSDDGLLDTDDEWALHSPSSSSDSDGADEWTGAPKASHKKQKIDTTLDKHKAKESKPGPKQNNSLKDMNKLQENFCDWQDDFTAPIITQHCGSPSRKMENIMVPTPPPYQLQNNDNVNCKNWPKLEEGLVPLRPPFPLPQNCIPVPGGMTSGLLHDGKSEGGDMNVYTEKLSVVSVIKLKEEKEGSIPVPLPQNCVPVKVEKKPTSPTCPIDIQTWKEGGDCRIPSQAESFQSLQLNILPYVSAIDSKDSSTAVPSNSSSQSRFGQTIKPRLLSLSTRAFKDEIAEIKTESGDNTNMSEDGLFDTDEEWPLLSSYSSSDSNGAADEWTPQAAHKKQSPLVGPGHHNPQCVQPGGSDTSYPDISSALGHSLPHEGAVDGRPEPRLHPGYTDSVPAVGSTELAAVRKGIGNCQGICIFCNKCETFSSAVTLPKAVYLNYRCAECYIKPKYINSEGKALTWKFVQEMDRLSNSSLVFDNSRDREQKEAFSFNKAEQKKGWIGKRVTPPSYPRPLDASVTLRANTTLGVPATLQAPVTLGAPASLGAHQGLSLGSPGLQTSILNLLKRKTAPAQRSRKCKPKLSIPKRRKYTTAQDRSFKDMNKLLEKLFDKQDDSKGLSAVKKGIGKIQGCCVFCNNSEDFRLAIPWPTKVYLKYTCAECKISPKFTNPEGKALTWKFVKQINRLSNSPLVVDKSRDPEEGKCAGDKPSSNGSEKRQRCSAKKRRPLKGWKGQYPSKRVTRSRGKRGEKKYIEVMEDSESEQYNDVEHREDREAANSDSETPCNRSKPSHDHMFPGNKKSTNESKSGGRKGKIAKQLRPSKRQYLSKRVTRSRGTIDRKKYIEVEEDNGSEKYNKSEGNKMEEVGREVEENRDNSMENNTSPSVNQTSDGHSKIPSDQSTGVELDVEHRDDRKAGEISKPQEAQMLPVKDKTEESLGSNSEFPQTVSIEKMANQSEKSSEGISAGVNVIEIEINGNISPAYGNNENSQSPKPNVGDKDIEDNQTEPNRMDSREYTTDGKSLESHSFRKDLRLMHSTILDTGHDHGCSVCSMKAETFNELMEHLWFKHQVKVCDSCEVDFLLPGQYSRHMRTHVVENIKFCPLCCENVKDYGLHILHKHSNQGCSICGTKKIDSSGNTKDSNRKFNCHHVTAHKEIDALLKGNFHCHYPYCGFDSDLFDYLLKHLWYHHQDGKCPACETHPNHESFSSLLEHCHVSHQDLDTEPVKKANDPGHCFKRLIPDQVSCDICKKGMSGLITKLKHMWLIHNHASEHFTTGRHLALPQNVIADIVSRRFNQYQCWRCDWKDGQRDMSTLITHMWTCHGLRYCPYCDIPYDTLDKIQEHLHIHRSEFIIFPDSSTCPYIWCHRRMNSVFEMIRHLYHRHGPRLCPFCDALCELEIQFVAHIILHWQAVYDRDIILSFLAGSRYEKSNGERKCEICPFVSWRSEVTILHLWNDHGVRFCPTCNLSALSKKRCPTLPYFMMHIQEKHSLRPKPSCLLCGCTDNKARIDYSHLFQVHGVMNKNNSMNFLQCKICPGTFHSFPAAASHECVSFIGGSPCDTCGKVFTQQRLHMHSIICKKNQQTKAHLCEVCGQTFLNLGLKTSHMRIHSGEKPYKCQECGKAFARSDNLHTHMRSHSGVKPYVCEVCGKGFARGDNLKTHKRLMH